MKKFFKRFFPETTDFVNRPPFRQPHLISIGLRNFLNLVLKMLTYSFSLVLNVTEAVVSFGDDVLSNAIAASKNVARGIASVIGFTASAISNGAKNLVGYVSNRFGNKKTANPIVNDEELESQRNLDETLNTEGKKQLSWFETVSSYLPSNPLAAKKQPAVIDKKNNHHSFNFDLEEEEPKAEEKRRLSF